MQFSDEFDFENRIMDPAELPEDTSEGALRVRAAQAEDAPVEGYIPGGSVELVSTLCSGGDLVAYLSVPDCAEVEKEALGLWDIGEVDVYGSKEAVFDDPKTLSGAILTGCKNISPIHKLDEHHALAKNWGLTLQTSREVGDAEYIGIRMHDVRYAGASDTNKINNKSTSDGISRIGYKNDCLIDETDGFSKNIFSMEVSEVVENPFSYTVMLRGKYKDIGWETEKPFGKTLRPSETVRIQLPPDAILLLKK